MGEGLRVACHMDPANTEPPAPSHPPMLPGQDHWDLLVDPATFLAWPQEEQLATISGLIAQLLSTADIIAFLALDPALASQGGGFVESLLLTLQRPGIAAAVQAILLKLLGILLGAGTTVRILKRALRLAIAQVSPANSLRALQQAAVIARERAGPQSVFVFGGEGAGFTVSGVGKWPFSREYALVFWMRVEEDAEPCIIMSFLTSDRHGINIMLAGNELVGFTLMFEASDDRKRDGARVSIPRDLLRPREWHHMIIHHFTKRFGASEVNVLVDGQPVSTVPHKLMFPTKVSKAISSAHLMRDMNGLTGPVTLFHESPPRPGLMQKLAKDELASVLGSGESTRPGSGVLWEAPATSRCVFLSYHPDHVPQGTLSSVDLHGSHHGELGERSAVWTRLSVQDTLRAVGGVQDLLPLLWQQPAQIREKQRKGEPVAMTPVQAFIHVLNLVAACVDGHRTNQEDFLVARGPNLVSIVLPNAVYAPDAPLTPAVVDAVYFLQRACKRRRVTSTSGPRLRVLEYGQLERRIDKMLFFNFRLWASCGGLRELASGDGHASDDAPKDMASDSVDDGGCLLAHVVDVIERRVLERPDLFRKEFGVEAMLDSLRDMYGSLFASELEEDEEDDVGDEDVNSEFDDDDGDKTSAQVVSGAAHPMSDGSRKSTLDFDADEDDYGAVERVDESTALHLPPPPKVPLPSAGEAPTAAAQSRARRGPTGTATTSPELVRARLLGMRVVKIMRYMLAPGTKASRSPSTVLSTRKIPSHPASLIAPSVSESASTGRDSDESHHSASREKARTGNDDEKSTDDGSRSPAQRSRSRIPPSSKTPAVAHSLTPEEFSAILNAVIGAGQGAMALEQHNNVQSSSAGRLQESPLRARKGGSWDLSTTELAHDALRLLILLMEGASPVSNVYLLADGVSNGAGLAAVLSVNVLAVGGIDERVRALALRVAGLYLTRCAAQAGKKAARRRPAGGGANSAATQLSSLHVEDFARRGGFSYLAQALSVTAVRGSTRYSASSSHPGTKGSAMVRNLFGGDSMRGAGAMLSRLLRTPKQPGALFGFSSSNSSGEKDGRSGVRSSFSSSGPDNKNGSRRGSGLAGAPSQVSSMADSLGPEDEHDHDSVSIASGDVDPELIARPPSDSQADAKSGGGGGTLDAEAGFVPEMRRASSAEATALTSETGDSHSHSHLGDGDSTGGGDVQDVDLDDSDNPPLAAVEHLPGAASIARRKSFPQSLRRTMSENVAMLKAAALGRAGEQNPRPSRKSSLQGFDEKADSPVGGLRSSSRAERDLSASLPNAAIGERLYNALLDLMVMPGESLSSASTSGSSSSANSSTASVSGTGPGDGEGGPRISDMYLEHTMLRDDDHNSAMGCDPTSVLILDETQRICNQHVLLIILKLLPRMDLFLKQKALQDLFLLLKFQRSNRTAFAAVSHWSANLFELLGEIAPALPHEGQEGTSFEFDLLRTGADGIDVTKSDKTETGQRVAFDMCVKLFVLLLSDGVTRTLEGNEVRSGGLEQLELVFALQPLAVSGERIAANIVWRLFLELRDDMQGDPVDGSVRLVTPASAAALFAFAESLLLPNVAGREVVRAKHAKARFRRVGAKPTQQTSGGTSDRDVNEERTVEGGPELAAGPNATDRSPSMLAALFELLDGLISPSAPLPRTEQVQLLCEEYCGTTPFDTCIRLTLEALAKCSLTTATLEAQAHARRLRILASFLAEVRSKRARPQLSRIFDLRPVPGRWIAGVPTSARAFSPLSPRAAGSFQAKGFFGSPGTLGRAHVEAAAASASRRGGSATNPPSGVGPGQGSRSTDSPVAPPRRLNENSNGRPEAADLEADADVRVAAEADAATGADADAEVDAVADADADADVDASEDADADAGADAARVAEDTELAATVAMTKVMKKVERRESASSYGSASGFSDDDLGTEMGVADAWVVAIVLESHDILCRVRDALYSHDEVLAGDAEAEGEEPRQVLDVVTVKQLLSVADELGAVLSFLCETEKEVLGLVLADFDALQEVVRSREALLLAASSRRSSSADTDGGSSYSGGDADAAPGVGAARGGSASAEEGQLAVAEVTDTPVPEGLTALESPRTGTKDQYERSMAWIFDRWLLQNVEDGGGLVQALLALREFHSTLNKRVHDRRRAVWEKHLKQRDTEASDAKLRAQLEKSVLDFESRAAYMELSRLSSRAQKRDETLHSSMLQWQRMVLDSDNQSSIWWVPGRQVHTMVSEREDYLRRHVLEKRNHFFDDHASATYAEGIAVPPTALEDGPLARRATSIGNADEDLTRRIAGLRINDPSQEHAREMAEMYDDDDFGGSEGPNLGAREGPLPSAGQGPASVHSKMPEPALAGAQTGRAHPEPSGFGSEPTAKRKKSRMPVPLSPTTPAPKGPGSARVPMAKEGVAEELDEGGDADEEGNSDPEDGVDDEEEEEEEGDDV